MRSPAVADPMFVPSRPIHSYPVSAAGHSEIRTITFTYYQSRPHARHRSLQALGWPQSGISNPVIRQRSGIGVRDCYLPLNFSGIKYTYRPLSLTYYDVRIGLTYYNDIVVIISTS
jgi:hypothetical protein